MEFAPKERFRARELGESERILACLTDIGLDEWFIDGENGQGAGSGNEYTANIDFSKRRLKVKLEHATGKNGGGTDVNDDIPWSTYSLSVQNAKIEAPLIFTYIFLQGSPAYEVSEQLMGRIDEYMESRQAA